MPDAPDPAILRTAADVIRRKGLAKGIYQGFDGTRCIVGALREAKMGDRPVAPEIRYLAEYPFVSPHQVAPEIHYLAEYLGVPIVEEPHTIAGFNGVTSWNDDPERIPDEVVTLLEEAAEKLEADR